MHGTQMAGRKRRAGARYPSGELEKERAPTLTRRMAMIAGQAKDPALTNALGWLRLQRQISDRQAEAGRLFAILVGQHDLVLGSPRRSAASPAYERGFSGPLSQGDNDLDAADVERIRRRFDAATSCLSVGIPGIMIAVCVEDQVPTWSERRLLIVGLEQLAAHFDGGRRKLDA